MFSRFFIDRPIFASVLSLVIALTGGISFFSLPIAQYPQIAPPTIQVMCAYPGASARVVAESVAAPIEQQVNGVENMLYMSSQCSNDGSYGLTVTFKPGSDLNIAQVLVQNRVNLALPQLPDVVKQTGVTTRRRSPDILMFVSIYSPDGSRDNLFLSNYATLQIRDELARVDGIGDVFMFGQQDYSMRVWVNPEQLAYRNMTAGDVVRALREQNVQVAAGQIGQPPVGDYQQLQMTFTVLGRLSEPEQFEQIVLKTTPEGRSVRLKDIAAVRLDPRNQDIVSRVDGKPTASVALFQLPDANALATRDRVLAKMEELSQHFPPGVAYDSYYDTTPFIRESVREVYSTLGAAVVLVALVVLVFLQNWRSALIPLVAVPVAIIGTFGAMAALGFSINNLTLFGLVLATCIVVDDAIVVVEAVEHHIEQGMLPRQATIRAMEEVSGPVIAVGLVLSAVFVPCAFISGITGQFFRQFALTIAVSTIISTFNSLTLSPALAALLLKPRSQGVYEPLPRLAFVLVGGWLGWQILAPRLEPELDHLKAALIDMGGTYLARAETWLLPGVVTGMMALAGWVLSRPGNWFLGHLFHLFNRGFNHFRGTYTRLVGLALRGSVLVLMVYGGLLTLTAWSFTRLPVGYIPSQDMGTLRVAIQLPDAASLERTRKVVEEIDRIVRATDGVAHAISGSGQAFVIGAVGSNFGQMFVILDEFHERRRRGLTSEVIAGRLRREIEARVPDARVAIFGAPPVTGLGMAGGFKFILEDRGDVGLNELQAQADKFIFEGNRTPGLTNLMTTFRANSPQLYVDVNRDECRAKQVEIRDVFNTLQVFLGSLYVNDFNKFGRTWQVIVQAQSRFRDRLEDVKQLKVRNANGDMVPLGTLASVREINGPMILTRYNMYPAAVINGNTTPDLSSGQGIELVQQLAARELSPAMRYEWTEITFMQVQAGNNIWNLLIFPLSVLAVFLVLAALYESWSLPLAVILVVPMCLLGSITGVAVAGSDLNIFTQIGFVVLVGLASKNAILIVEFAKVKRERGLTRQAATLEACWLRLRPILMTSFAFILGVVPLLTATGAGAEMRRRLGTAVFSGMLGVTLFGIFLTPVFFFVINRLTEGKVFSSRNMRILSGSLFWAFIVLTLGLAWLLPRGFRFVTRARPSRSSNRVPDSSRKKL